jgi:CoA:oxalate CoA-transferase
MGGVLEGIKVLDLSRVFAGPASAQILGDLGADVVKIEDPSGDDARFMGIAKDRLVHVGGSSPSFHAFNRNKRSLVLDFHYDEARQALLKLAATADVLIHNFRPGVMEKWGVGPSHIAAINPRLIYAEFSAYGSVGPMSHIGANDSAVQAYSGLMNVTGETDRPPVRCGSAIVDLHGGLALSTAILAALLHRGKTGKGQRVEASLLLSAADLMSYQYADYWADGTVNQRMGTANNLSAPNQAFPTRDGSVIIIAPVDDMWQRCANALDAKELNILEFKSGFDRLRLREKLVAAICKVTRTMTTGDVLDRLGEARVNVANVNTIPEAADSEQLAAVQGTFEVTIGTHVQKVVGSPFRLADAPPKVRHPPPQIGQHTDAILSEAGFSAAEVERLRISGAFGRPGK